MTLRERGCESCTSLRFPSIFLLPPAHKEATGEAGRAKALQSLFAFLIERLKNVGEFYDGDFPLGDANGFMQLHFLPSVRFRARIIPR